MIAFLSRVPFLTVAVMTCAVPLKDDADVADAVYDLVAIVIHIGAWFSSLSCSQPPLATNQPCSLRLRSTLGHGARLFP